MIAKKTKVVVRCLSSGWFSLRELIAIFPEAMDNHTSFRRAKVAEQALVGSRRCFTSCPVRVLSTSSLLAKAGLWADCKILVFSGQRQQISSMIDESPVAVVSRALNEAWWSLRTAAIVVDAVDTNGCYVG